MYFMIKNLSKKGKELDGKQLNLDDITPLVRLAYFVKSVYQVGFKNYTCIVCAHLLHGKVERVPYPALRLRLNTKRQGN